MGLLTRKKHKTEPGGAGTASSVKTVNKNQEAVKPSMKDLYSQPAAKTGKNDGLKPVNVTSIKERAGKQGRAYRVIVRPLVTEKASVLGAENKYIFEISRRANKIEVGRAIEEVYGVKPVSVNIIKVKGKKIRYGRTSGRRRDWKKAIVALPAGKTIKVYEGV